MTVFAGVGCHAEAEGRGGEASKSPQPPFTKGGLEKLPSIRGAEKSPFRKGGLAGLPYQRGPSKSPFGKGEFRGIFPPGKKVLCTKAFRGEAKGLRHKL